MGWWCCIFGQQLRKLHSTGFWVSLSLHSIRRSIAANGRIPGTNPRATSYAASRWARHWSMNAFWVRHSHRSWRGSLSFWAVTGPTSRFIW